MLTIRMLELMKLLNRYIYDELTLRDIHYMDELFEELINEIRNLKNDIVTDRTIKGLEELEKEIQ